MTLRGKWKIGQRAFDDLLAFLDADRETAGAKYEAIRARLVRLFEWRDCDTPEVLADETIDRVSRRISEGEEIRASEPLAYFYGVARNVLKEYWTTRQKEAVIEAQTIQPRPFPTDGQGAEDRERSERMDRLDRCLAGLNAENRDLILRYYRSEKGDKIAERARLATELGVTAGTLRIRAHRIRRGLERCVETGAKKGANA